MSIRRERIAEQIRGEIARVLREESSDPRIGLLTITRVKVSADLSRALVFWSPLQVDASHAPEDLADGLESASGFVRRQLARNLDLRRTPAIDWKYDPSIEEGSHTLSLIRSLDIEPELSEPEPVDGEDLPSLDDQEQPEADEQEPSNGIGNFRAIVFGPQQRPYDEAVKDLLFRDIEELVDLGLAADVLDAVV